MQLAGKIAVVTGASAGIGRAVALAFAREGADLALVARRAAALEELAGEARSLGRRALTVPTDLRDEVAVRQMAERVLAEYGRVDVLFNGAGVGYVAPVARMALAEWEDTFAVNLRGTFLCARAFLPSMRERRAGSIINVASADRGFATTTAYNASKFGVVAFTQGLAEECSDFNIAVNCIRFGIVVDTKLGRDLHPGDTGEGWQKPEDVTDVIVCLATQDARGTTGGYISTKEWQDARRARRGRP